MSDTNPKCDVTRDDGACMKPGCAKCGALPADQGKHHWDINITCPRCRHVGNAAVAFDCCDCSAALKARCEALEAGLREIADLGDEHGCFPRCDCYSPEATRIWMEEVKDAARALLSPRDGEAE